MNNCINCGIRVDNKSKRCWECYKKEVEKIFPRKRCIICGKQFRRRSENITGVCGVCHINKHRFKPYYKRCKECGKEFLITARSKRGNKFCGNNCINKSHTKTTEEFIKEAKTTHGDYYNYYRVIYKVGEEKVEIGCKHHGWFWQRANNHLNGRGCPKCAVTHSKKERRIYKYLEKEGYIFEHQKRFDGCINPRTRKKLVYDFWLPFLNILIEYDGHQHFIKKSKIRGHQITSEQFEGIQYRDDIKNEYAKSNGIKLIRIKYTIKNIERYLKSKIKNLSI